MTLPLNKTKQDIKHLFLYEIYVFKRLHALIFLTSLLMDSVLLLGLRNRGQKGHTLLKTGTFQAFSIGIII